MAHLESQRTVTLVNAALHNDIVRAQIPVQLNEMVLRAQPDTVAAAKWRLLAVRQWAAQLLRLSGLTSARSSR